MLASAKVAKDHGLRVGSSSVECKYLATYTFYVLEADSSLASARIRRSLLLLVGHDSEDVGS
jgi:hypothetical protein